MLCPTHHLIFLIQVLLPKGLTSPTIHGSGPHHSGNPNLAHKYEASPASDRSLDQRRRSSATGSVSGHRNSNGGYYVDVSVDPTMNLPHNKSHPTTPSSLTPRNSTSAGDKGSNFTHRGSISELPIFRPYAATQ